MKFKFLHKWNLSPPEAVELQNQLQKSIFNREREHPARRLSEAINASRVR